MVDRLSRKNKKQLKKAFGEKAYAAFLNNSKPGVYLDPWFDTDTELERSMLYQEHIAKELFNSFKITDSDQKQIVKKK